jgi:hypothetical protein
MGPYARNKQPKKVKSDILFQHKQGRQLEDILLIVITELLVRFRANDKLIG